MEVVAWDGGRGCVLYEDVLPKACLLCRIRATDARLSTWSVSQRAETRPLRTESECRGHAGTAARAEPHRAELAAGQGQAGAAGEAAGMDLTNWRFLSDVLRALRMLHVVLGVGVAV